MTAAFTVGVSYHVGGELLVERVIEALKPDRVILVEGAKEEVFFVLPKELR